MTTLLRAVLQPWFKSQGMPAVVVVANNGFSNAVVYLVESFVLTVNVALFITRISGFESRLVGL